MTSHEIQQVLNCITYKQGWHLHLHWKLDDRPYIQVECTGGVDSQTGARTKWVGAKHFLSEFMCKQEIVGVAFKAIKDAEEHEMREWFRYNGASIFNPHLDPDVLAEVAKKQSSFCMRTDSMTKA